MHQIGIYMQMMYEKSILIYRKIMMLEGQRYIVTLRKKKLNLLYFPFISDFFHLSLYLFLTKSLDLKKYILKFIETLSVSGLWRMCMHASMSDTYNHYFYLKNWPFNEKKKICSKKGVVSCEIIYLYIYILSHMKVLLSCYKSFFFHWKVHFLW